MKTTRLTITLVLPKWGTKVEGDKFATTSISISTPSNGVCMFILDARKTCVVPDLSGCTNYHIDVETDGGHWWGRIQQVVTKNNEQIITVDGCASGKYWWLICGRCAYGYWHIEPTQKTMVESLWTTKGVPLDEYKQLRELVYIYNSELGYDAYVVPSHYLKLLLGQLIWLRQTHKTLFKKVLDKLQDV